MNKKLIFEKTEKLSELKIILKKEFVGLNDIIDEIVDLIEPWYLFPENQFRPTVINMFGMTGTGKTSLVLRIFEYLELTSLMRFDTGEWVEQKSGTLSDIISENNRKINNFDGTKNEEVNNKSSNKTIFLFDEFQLGRTIGSGRENIDRPNLRVMWDLLDSGKFTIVEDNWQKDNLQALYVKLSYLINTLNVKAKFGKITQNKKEWDLYFTNDDDSENDWYCENPLVPTNELYALSDLSKDFISDKQLGKYLMTLQSEKEILLFLEKILVTSTTPTEYDFSDSIIFIVGNLDEAYALANDMDADLDANFLYEHTKKINISNIKQSLSYLYKPEQISRLGNNYIIYRSFNEETYKELIKMELNKISIKVYDKFNFKINYSDKIKELIYKEGVFATQGVRPIFSTVTSLIETKLGKIIVDLNKQNIDAKEIFWDVDDKYEFLNIKVNDDIELKYKITLKVENLRKSLSNDIQALIGIHEAGHVICDVYGLNLCPEIAVSKTIVEGGFTQTNYPDYKTKTFMMNQIVTLFGGHAAEELVFGSDNITSGSVSDLEKSTNIALNMYKDYGMDPDNNLIPASYSEPDFRISTDQISDEDIDYKVKYFLSKQYALAKKILTDNMVLLLEMGEYLTEHSKIEKDKIKELVKKYGDYDIPKYKDYKQYYDFKNILYSKKHK